jgi:hypothetical protein
MAFDLAEYYDTLTLAEEGIPMTLLNLRTRQPLLNDDGSPVTISLLGQQSKTFRALMGIVQSRRAEIGLRNQQTDTDQREREDIDFLVACTTDWTIQSLDGQPFPCTMQNIRKLWNDPRFRTLRGIALGFVMNDANFLPPSPSGSEPSPATSSSSKDRSRTAEPSQMLSEATD